MTPIEAFDRLHAAILALGPKVETTDPGSTTIEAARGALTQLQTVILLIDEGISAKSLAPNQGENGVFHETVVFDAPVHAALTRFHKSNSDTKHLHETIYQIIRAWLEDRGKL